MKSHTRRRWTVILPIALVGFAVSVSGCQMTPFQRSAADVDPPPDHATTTDGEVALERALSLAAEKRHSEAREVLDPLLQRESQNTRARLLHGVLRAHEGRVGDAMEIFETLRRDYPDMSEPYVNLAVLYAVEGRLDDARKILLATLERRPSAVAYASLGDVYRKLAEEADERARELDAVAVESSDGEAAPLPVASDAPAGRVQTGSQDDDTQPTQSIVGSRQAGSEPVVPVRRRPDAAVNPPSAAPEPESVEMPPAMAVRAQAPGPQSGDTLAMTAETVAAASKAVPIPGDFCADAGGFPDRRSVAEAALWLQSYGAEVIEVRRDERRVANSYRVYLPPFDSRRQAVAKLQEIRDSGERDVFVIPDGDLANGISFGIYRDEGNMHRRVAALEDLGHAVQSQAADETVVGEYAIDARVSGSPATLDAVWSSRFPEKTIRVVDCG